MATKPPTSNIPEGSRGYIYQKPFLQLSTSPARAPVASVDLLYQLFHLFHVEKLTWDRVKTG